MGEILLKDPRMPSNASVERLILPSDKPILPSHQEHIIISPSKLVLPNHLRPLPENAADKKSGYDFGGRVEISPQMEAKGIELSEVFEKKIRRAPVWIVSDEKIMKLALRRYEPEILATFPHLRDKETFTWEDISVGLENEKLSPLLAENIHFYMWIEDKIPDYANEGTREFRSLAGLDDFYLMWPNEESSHGKGMRNILNRTQHAPITQQQHEDLQKDYYENQRNRWRPPFETGRQMLGYARIQEYFARKVYKVVAERARMERAPITAEIIELIRADEAYHAHAFKLFLEVEAKYDEEGTRNDVIMAARHFEMPAQRLRPNPGVDLRNARTLGTFSRDILRASTEASLGSLSFIGRKAAKKLADEIYPRKKAA